MCDEVITSSPGLQPAIRALFEINLEKFFRNHYQVLILWRLHQNPR